MHTDPDLAWRDDTIELPDGRVLGWATWGAEPGDATTVAVALHGGPDARRIWGLFHEAAVRHGVRLVCPDRPGFGLSTPAPDGDVDTGIDDLGVLLDHLGLSRFPVITISAGAIHGCALAARWTDRVTGLGLLAPMGPLDAPGATDGMNWQVRVNYWLAAHAPLLLWPIAGGFTWATAHHRDTAIKRLIGTRPPEDRRVAERPEVTAMLRANIGEQFKDAATVRREFRLAARPWPVALDRITAPTTIWHGDRDDVHTPAMARHLERSIPGAVRVERAGYATFNFVDDADPLFATLASWAPSGDAP